MIAETRIPVRKCRFCGAPLEQKFIDIAYAKSSSQLKTDSCSTSTYVCSECFLVQMENSTMPSNHEHIYTSRFSSTWLNDMSEYINNIFKRFEIIDHHLTAELVSHRGPS